MKTSLYDILVVANLKNTGNTFLKTKIVGFVIVQVRQNTEVIDDPDRESDTEYFVFLIKG